MSSSSGAHASREQEEEEQESYDRRASQDQEEYEEGEEDQQQQRQHAGQHVIDYAHDDNEEVDDEDLTEDPELRDATAATALAFERLVHDVHLPLLDVLLLRKYLVSPDSAPALRRDKIARLQKLMHVVEAMSLHKSRTLKVLHAIAQREALLQELMRLNQHCHDIMHGGDEQRRNKERSHGDTDGRENDQQQDEERRGGGEYEDEKRASPQRRAQQREAMYSAQAAALKCFYLLQQRTLDVVTVINDWRNGLTRPYPFVFQNNNYLLMILAQMRDIQKSPLNDLLPLGYTRYPLFSNVPSLNKFREAALADSSAPASQQQHQQHMVHPLRKGQGQSAAAAAAARNSNPKIQQALTEAEKTIRDEVDTQLAITHELMELCAEGYFVPVLDLASALKGGAWRGQGARRRFQPGVVRVMSVEWQERLKQALLNTLEGLVNPEFVDSRRQFSGIGSGDGDDAGAGENGAAVGPAQQEDRE